VLQSVPGSFSPPGESYRHQNLHYVHERLCLKNSEYFSSSQSFPDGQKRPARRPAVFSSHFLPCDQIPPLTLRPAADNAAKKSGAKKNSAKLRTLKFFPETAGFGTEKCRHRFLNS
jgi:hypothetical protein